MDDNSIKEVEQFITDEFKEDPRFAQGINNKGIFKFLPGHRHRIFDFISTVKLSLTQEQTAKRLKLKRKCDKGPIQPALKKHASGGMPPKEERLFDISDQQKMIEIIWQQVAKWQRNQNSCT